MPIETTAKIKADIYLALLKEWTDDYSEIDKIIKVAEKIFSSIGLPPASY